MRKPSERLNSQNYVLKEEAERQVKLGFRQMEGKEEDAEQQQQLSMSGTTKYFAADASVEHEGQGPEH